MLHHQHISSLFLDDQRKQQYDHQKLISSQMGFFSHPHPSNDNLNFLIPHNNQLLPYPSSSSSSPNNPSHLSLQKSTSNNWDCGEENDDRQIHPLRVSALKMKKIKPSRRNVREPRFCFKTLSEIDVLDDGYKWRKYGKKVVKNTQHPRSYYRCAQNNCRVKKRVERLAEDPRMVITTYEGRHPHSPSHDLEDSNAINNFLW